jgi:hypothetical protein
MFLVWDPLQAFPLSEDTPIQIPRLLLAKSTAMQCLDLQTHPHPDQCKSCAACCSIQELQMTLPMMA